MITKIFGAPGTGKTTRLLDILVEEIKNGVPLEKIAFITHTVSARDEARSRAAKIVSAKKDSFRYFRTIHGICFKELGLTKSQVMQPPDYMEFGDDVGIAFSANFSEELDEDGLPIGYNSSQGNQILAIRQLAAAQRVAISSIEDKFPTWMSIDDTTEILGRFRAFKSERTKFDFLDMLEMFMEHPEPIDADVIIVDEAQDLSRLQWAVVDEFRAKAKRVYIAGDDDQSIYGFIGADPYGFLDHPCDETVILPRTYRLKSRIWRFAQGIIRGVERRQDKAIQVDAEGGEIDYWNTPLEAVPVDADDFHTTMVVARHHKQLHSVASMLRERGIPFSHSGESLVGTPRARAVFNYHLLQEGAAIPMKDAVEVLSYTYTTKLKDARASARDRPDLLIDARSMSQEYALDVKLPWDRTMVVKKSDEWKNEQLSNVVQEKGYEALLKSPTIDLTTYHACKGRQANHVILLTDVYAAAARSELEEPDEARRLAYVGVTRTIDKLTIITPQSDLFMRALL